MSVRLWTGVGALVAGGALLVAAQVAGASSSGQILRVGDPGASVQIDPQLAYNTTSWWLEDATGATLVTWSPRGRLVPQAASGYAVAGGGRVYRFVVRAGMRFSDGAPVTAASFAYAIRRLRSRELASPGAEYADGIRRVEASGRTLVIRLARPDPSFLAELALPFFQATSTTLPLGREVIGPYPSAGRYAFSQNEVNVQTSLRRNPYWAGTPGRLDGVDVAWNQDVSALVDDVDAGRLDEVDVVPAERRQALADRFGTATGRFRVRPTACIGFIGLNGRSPLLRGNPALRRAINYAVDRTAYADAAGPYAGEAWSRLVPPGAATSVQPYPLRADLGRAARIARGHLRGGRITVYYRSSGTAGPVQAALVRDALVGLGFAPGDVTMKGFSGGNIYTAFGAGGSRADLGVSMGLCSQTRSGLAPPDPADYLDAFLAPPFGLPAPAFRAQLAAARRLDGSERTRALARLEHEVSRSLAPAVVTRTLDDQFFFSDRVDLGSLRYEQAVGNWSLASLALK